MPETAPVPTARRRNRVRPVAAFVVGLAGLLAFGSGRASAHAIIMESMPAVGASVAGPDVTIALRFNSRIDRLRSRLILTQPDQTMRTLAIEAGPGPEYMTAKASGLAPGRYTLRWQALSIDGHITRGDIPFVVGTP